MNKLNQPNFKQRLTKQLNGLQKNVDKHPWEAGITPNNLFAKYPDAMKTLGVSNQHYYRDASKQQGLNKHEPVENGVYPIADADYGGIDKAHKDIITPKELSADINDFKQNPMHELDSSDLKEMEEGNNNNLYATTSPNFKETNYKQKYNHEKEEARILAKGPDYFPNNIKKSIKDIVTDAWHLKQEYKNEKHIYNAGYNPKAVNDIDMNGNHPTLKQNLDLSKNTLQPPLDNVAKHFTHTKIGKQALQEEKQNYDPKYEAQVESNTYPKVPKNVIKNSVQLNSNQSQHPLHQFSSAIKNNHIKPNEYGKWFDKHPNYSKKLNIYSGKQAKNKITKNIKKSNNYLHSIASDAPSNLTKAISNDRDYSKKALKKIKPNMAYTGEQIQQATPLGKKALSQNVHSFISTHDSIHHQDVKHDLKTLNTLKKIGIYNPSDNKVTHNHKGISKGKSISTKRHSRKQNKQRNKNIKRNINRDEPQI